MISNANLALIVAMGICCTNQLYQNESENSTPAKNTLEKKKNYVLMLLLGCWNRIKQYLVLIEEFFFRLSTKTMTMAIYNDEMI